MALKDRNQAFRHTNIFHTIITKSSKVEIQTLYTYISSYQELSIWLQVLGDFSPIKTVQMVKLWKHTFSFTNLKFWAKKDG